jgi:uncharacterized protein DUF5615
VRLYADEDISKAIVDGLRAEHDIVFVTETKHREHSDAWHLMQATLEGRVLLTFNHTDYKFLHRVWTSAFNFDIDKRTHGGILTATRTVTAEAWLPALQRVFGGRDLAGRLHLWHEKTDKWAEDAWRPETDHPEN